MEYQTKVIGSSTRDVLTKRKVTDKTFFNQATLVIRKMLPNKLAWKEVNIKLFANGGIQMTGVPTPEFSLEAITYVLDSIKREDPEVFTGTVNLNKFRIQLINSDYSINRQIHQEKLHKILSNVYNLFSSHESTIYQGVNTKYYYNKKGNVLKPGICTCKNPCTGQGDGDGDGQCKKITISPFSSGKIIITGARDMAQINEAYVFFNDILRMHESEILISKPA
jgi:TATA-box binding protein (TBP) (component of TFIID and TFIIIB)